MKQVVMEYAGAVIAVLGAISFFLLFHQFFVGQNGVLGQMLVYSIGNYSLAENKAFDVYKENEMIHFTDQTEGNPVVNQKILLSDHCEAKDENGDVLPVYIKRAWDIDGKEVSFRIWEDGQIISFSSAGIYRVEVYTIDKSGKEISKIFQLFVNER